MRKGYYKRRNGYCIDFVLNGVRCVKKTNIKNVREIEAAVKAEKTRIQQALARGEIYVPDSNQPLTLGIAVERYLEESAPHRKPSSQEWARRSLEEMRDLLGASRPIETITTADMLRVRTAKAKSFTVRNRPKFGLVGPATINRSWQVPRSLFRWAERKWGVRPKAVIHWSDLMLREPSERVRVLSDKEAEALRTVMEGANKDYVAVWLFLLLTGVRMSEAINLKWSEVDFGRMVFTTTGKGDSVVYKMITPNVNEILQSRIGDDPVRVFPQITRDRMKKWWSGVRKRAAEIAPSLLADGNRFRLHDARHHYATNLLQRTGNLRLVQAELGHSKIETTARYAHVLEGDRRKLGAKAEAAMLEQTKFMIAAPEAKWIQQQQ